MKVIDSLPYVLKELAEAGGSCSQTRLTELVWGTSGRGNPRLVNLFEYMRATGLLARHQVLGAKLYSLTPAGQKKLEAVEAAGAPWRELGATAFASRAPEKEMLGGRET